MPMAANCGLSMFALCPGEAFQRSKAAWAPAVPATRFSPRQVLYAYPSWSIRVKGSRPSESV
jgi:hypothetical protein